MGIEPFLIASALAGGIAQRLLRTICPKCKEAYSPSKQAMINLGLEGDSNVQFFRGKGCPNSKGTGYKGRVGVYELMSINAEMRELILKKVGGPELQQAALRGGMRTLREDAMEKIL